MRTKLYIYASTAEILYKDLIDAELFKEIKKANFEEIDISEWDIFQAGFTPEEIEEYIYCME